MRDFLQWSALALGLAGFSQAALKEADPFAEEGNDHPTEKDSAFGDGGDPFGGGGGDPFGGGGADHFGEDFSPVEDINFGPSSEAIHTTIRFGPGVPEIAVEPTEESGAIMFEVSTPLGTIPILVQPAGPALALTTPPPREARSFRPPSIFSAPLPTGSGARALGFAGAFTSIADDATAASWNPAGLVQLKRPEVSVVYRYSRVQNDHTSSDDNIQTGEDSYQGIGLNYLTTSLPFQMPGMGNNAVLSINFQEAYDFESTFAARFKDTGREHFSRTNRDTFTETQIDRFIFEPSAIHSEVEITSEITTLSSSALSQSIDTRLDANMEFDQKGIIDAMGPAFALELSPRFAVGVAVNLYQDNTVEGGAIRSRTRSTYTAVSESQSSIVNRQTTSGEFTATQTTVVPGDGFLGSADIVIESEPTSGTFSEIVQEEAATHTGVRIIEGEVLEINEFDGLEGINATLGAWWVVNDFLTVGAALDLPWGAESKQKRSTTAKTTTFDRSHSRVLGTSHSVEVEQKDVEFEFPLYGGIGAFFLWRPNLYTAIDIGYAEWSEFAYNIKGEGRLNPLDGTAHGQHKIDDTWSVRVGTEYLLELESQKIEIPLRFGLVWEQRPAIGEPDDYHGFSLGTGLALGRGTGKWIFDVAYSLLQARDIQTLVPGEDSLSTDTVQDEFFVSLIKHF